jgi:hypothetical protein
MVAIRTLLNYLIKKGSCEERKEEEMGGGFESN